MKQITRRFVVESDICYTMYDYFKFQVNFLYCETWPSKKCLLLSAAKATVGHSMIDPIKLQCAIIHV